MNGRTDGENPFTEPLLALSASFREQLDGSLECDAFGRVASAQAGIRLAVRHVRPKAAIAKDDRLAARRIGTELLQRTPCSTSASTASRRLGEKRLCLLERDREELFLALEGTGL